jgi:hypothetical protein
MKKIALVITLISSVAAPAQTHKLEKLWETEAVVAVPESVLPYENGKKLYVSLIDGGGWDADGKGGVALLNADGTGLNQSWVRGLNAPKGMGLSGKHLYVADITEVVVINTRTGKTEKKIAIEGATGLNDITVDDGGIVYLSDSRTGKIWRLEKDVPTLFLENVRGVNGLKAVGSDLIIGTGRSLQRADSQKKITTIAELPQGIDGIEPIGNGDYLVTSWTGIIFYVYSDGRVDQLLDTRTDKKNTADIGYDPKHRIVFVPTFNGKTVASFKLR